MARRLTELLCNVTWHSSSEFGDVLINGIVSDSRECKPGMLFVALAGLQVDGHHYVRQVVEAGCRVVMVEAGRGIEFSGYDDLVLLEVPDTRVALGEMAASFYGYPARQMKMVAVTGTNGKTTTTYILEAIISEAGYRPGVIGTINYRYNGQEVAAPFTTPEPVLLQGLLREMADSGVDYVIMEASSHALAQKRLVGLEFDLALFTNLSRDHLDFHGDMEAYFVAKKGLFRQLKRSGIAVVVIDDAVELEESWSRRLLDELKCDWRQAGDGYGPVISCGLEEGCDVIASKVVSGIDGIRAQVAVGGYSVELVSKLIGEFNLKNIIGAVAVTAALGIDLDFIVRGVRRVSKVPGRLEKIVDDGGGAVGASSLLNVFVDYAHTPDALENALRTLAALIQGRVFVVFGCGGDRDQGKRFLMGQIAGQLGDVVIITEDNSRSESKAAIIAEIERGVRDDGRLQRIVLTAHDVTQGYVAIADRSQAISKAIGWARPEDVVLIAGKGHEDYQITRDGRVYFDDRLEAKKNLMAS